MCREIMMTKPEKLQDLAKVASTTDTSCYSVAAFNYSSRKDDPLAQPTQTFEMVEPILCTEMQGLYCLINGECVL